MSRLSNPRLAYWNSAPIVVPRGRIAEQLYGGRSRQGTVPPLKHKIAGGHVSLWNGGLMLYRLVLAGFDCKEAKILRYGNNISVILRKREVDVLGEIEYARGDIRKIRNFCLRV